MESNRTKTETINYGIDAPKLMQFFFLSGLSAFILSGCIHLYIDAATTWVLLIIGVLALIACYLTGMGCLMIYESKITKLKECENILNQIQWKGDEQVLDIGCGRGLMLIGAAKRLTSGKATGVDIWQAKDQSSNTPKATFENARIEGVFDKIEVKTADMRSLPFADHSFDIVVSNWVVHNLESAADRNKAIDEMVRVLRPNGSLILADIEHRKAYCDTLLKMGLVDYQITFKPVKDVILNIVSFGSFRPATIIAKKSA